MYVLPKWILLRLFCLVLFNYIMLSHDAHLKNFSLIDMGKGDFRIAPAYDLIITSLHLLTPRSLHWRKACYRKSIRKIRNEKKWPFSLFLIRKMAKKSKKSGVFTLFSVFSGEEASKKNTLRKVLHTVDVFADDAAATLVGC